MSNKSQSPIVRAPEFNIDQWIDKNNTQIMNVNQDKNKHEFTLSIEGKSATINYKIENNNAYLIYSNVPDSFRRRGMGKFLIQKTHEKLIKDGYNPIPICCYIKAVFRQNISSQKFLNKSVES